MFLTRGVLHHEAAWALWFAHARGLLPRTLIRARGCEPALLQALAAACGAAASPRLLQQQHLFSVYVHIGANDAEFAGAPAPFHNVKLKRYVQLLQQQHLLFVYAHIAANAKLTGPAALCYSMFLGCGHADKALAAAVPVLGVRACTHRQCRPCW